jgi:tRNA 2-selenouridine synthase SelU
MNDGVTNNELSSPLSISTPKKKRRAREASTSHVQQHTQKKQTVTTAKEKNEEKDALPFEERKRHKENTTNIFPSLCCSSPRQITSSSPLISLTV